MNKIKKIALTVGILALGCISANASTITYNAQSGPMLTDFGFTLNLQKFNIAGATLTGVTLNFSGTDDILSLSINNTANTAQSFKATAQSDVFLTGNSAATDLVGTDLALNLFNSGMVTLGPNGSMNCAPASPNSTCDPVAYNPPSVTATTGNVSVGNISNYLGAGNFALTGNTLSGYQVQGGGNNVMVALTTQATINGSVTYTYTTSGTPEPATFALFGGALIGLGFLRKRATK